MSQNRYEYTEGDYITNRYSIIQVIHEDSSSFCKVINKEESDEIRILKIIKKKKYLQRNNLKQSQANRHFEKLQEKVKLMCSWKSPYIMRYYNCELAQKQIQIEMQYLNGDNLFEHAKMMRNFTRADAFAITRQALLCIKEYNKLTNEPFRKIQMTDFMFHNKSLKLINCREYHLTRVRQICDTQNYICEPELSPEELTIKGYRSDIWSLGALFVVLLFWKQQNQYFTYNHIAKYIDHEDVPSFIKKCLDQKYDMSLDDFEGELQSSRPNSLPSRIYLFPKVEPVLNEFSRSLSQNINTTIEYVSQGIEKLNNSQKIKQGQVFSELCKQSGQDIKKMERLYFKIKKAQYIRVKIIEKISQSNWGNKNRDSRYYIEIMYLLWKIVSIDVNDGYSKIKGLSIIEKDEYNVSNISSFHEQVRKQCEQYENKLLHLNNSFYRYYWRKLTKSKEMTELTQRKQVIKFAMMHMSYLQKEISEQPYLHTKLYHKLREFESIVDYGYDECLNIYDRIEEKVRKLMMVDSVIL